MTSKAGFAQRRVLAGASITLLAFLLGGCAVSRRIDSEVQSFSGSVAPVAGATYRFERLPSQIASPEQPAFESMARDALAKVGLTESVATEGANPGARYGLQLGVQITRFQKAPGNSLHWGGMLGTGGDRHLGVRWMSAPDYWYRHSVQMVLRELPGNQVAFETTANFESPWADSQNLLPVVMDAALQGYPNTPRGPRTVVIELPPQDTN